jgi:hypothetical protein
MKSANGSDPAAVVRAADGTQTIAKGLIALCLLAETYGKRWGKLRLLSQNEQRNCHLQEF